MSATGGARPSPAMAAQLKRFEQILKRPENRECFDCTAKQPRWASTNLGIFFCLRCAGIHRSLGVHISKVKSSTMDLWEDSMIDCCDRIGNSNGRELYEARLPPSYRKPESSTDTSAVERLLRQKYEQKAFYATNFNELRERFLSTVPRDVAPTPVPASPFVVANSNSSGSSTQPTATIGTPTFSLGAVSPTTLSSPPDSRCEADWSAFHSSPTVPPLLQSGGVSTAGARHQHGMISAAHANAAANAASTDDIWSAFTSGIQQSSSTSAQTTTRAQIDVADLFAPTSSTSAAKASSISAATSALDSFFVPASSSTAAKPPTLTCLQQTSGDLFDFGVSNKAASNKNTTASHAQDIMAMFASTQPMRR